jgi:hypothetical protein
MEIANTPSLRASMRVVVCRPEPDDTDRFSLLSIYPDPLLGRRLNARLLSCATTPANTHSAIADRVAVAEVVARR